MYRAEDTIAQAIAAAATPGEAIDPPPQSIKYRHVKEDEEGGLLELFLGPCPVCGGGSNGAALCAGGSSGSQGECVRSWYVGDAAQCVVYYVAFAAAAAAEEAGEAWVTASPPRLGWRLAVPLGVAPAPQLVYHQGLRPVEESAAAVAAAGAGAATETEEDEEELTATSTNRSKRSSSWGSSTGTGASFPAAASDGFPSAAATVGDCVAAGELGSLGRVRRVHRRRRSRRASRKTLVAEEGEGNEEGKGKEDGSDEIARLVASASVLRPLPAPSRPPPSPSGPSCSAALAAASAQEEAQRAEETWAAAALRPAGLEGAISGTEDGQGPVSVLPREYDEVVRWLEEQDRGLRAALGAREEGEHDASDDEEEDGDDDGIGEGESMPLSLEARVRGLRERWNEDEEACAREETQGRQHVQGRQEAAAAEEQVKGETAAGGEGAEVSADEGEGTGPMKLLGGIGGSTVLAPLKVEVLGAEEGEGRRAQQHQEEEALFLLRLASLESDREPQPFARTHQQPPAAPVHRVRILRRPRSALLKLHHQLCAALPPVAAAALPPFPPAPPQAEAPQWGGAFALLAGGGSGGNAGQQQKRRREACRRLETHLTALVRAVEGAACAPAAALLRAGLVDEREDVVVRLHADPCPSVTSAERQALWAAQRGRCRGCGVRLAQGQGVAARLLLLPGMSSGQRQPFMTCRYLRALFCMGPACGGGGGDDDEDKEPHAVLPGPILRAWSFRPRRVSHLAAAYLEEMRPLPLLVLPPEGDSEVTTAGKARRAVEYLVALRRQLAQLARHCDGQCPAAARMLARCKGVNEDRAGCWVVRVKGLTGAFHQQAQAARCCSRCFALAFLAGRPAAAAGRAPLGQTDGAGGGVGHAR